VQKVVEVIGEVSGNGIQCWFDAIEIGIGVIHSLNAVNACFD